MGAWHERVKEKRELVDALSQAELGRRFGIKANPQGVVSRMESGVWPEDPARQQAIADYLDEDVIDLRREANNRMPGAEGLDDLRTLVSELRTANADILEALRETNDRLAELAGAIAKLGRKSS